MRGQWMAALAALMMGLWVMAPAVAAAQEFSADLVTHDDKGDRTQTQKIFASGSKIRIEAPGTVILSDTANQTSKMLMASSKSYVEMATPSGMGRAFFRVDPANACEEWRALAKKDTGAVCQSVGPETIDGRSTVKIEGESPDHRKGAAWIDTKLRFVIKVQGEGFGMEVKNIKEGPQAADLFTVPADYKKMDRQQMLHSGAD